MMLMSGVKRASTIVPTINARNTIMMGSSIDVSAATALSTCLFAYIDHAADHRWKSATGFQRLHD